MTTDHNLVINTKPIIFDETTIKLFEEKYNATYVCETCIRDLRGNWTEFPVAIFWQEMPPVEGYSHYFAAYRKTDFNGRGSVFIASGQTAVDEPIYAVVAKNGEVIYSRYRHDFRTSSDGSVTIDGGRDYTRLVGNVIPTQVTLEFEGPKLVISK